MKKNVKYVYTLQELVEEVNNNTTILNQRTTAAGWACLFLGVGVLFCTRLIAKQEEALCDLTVRVKKLEDVHEGMDQPSPMKEMFENATIDIDLDDIPEDNND